MSENANQPAEVVVNKKEETPSFSIDDIQKLKNLLDKALLSADAELEAIAILKQNATSQAEHLQKEQSKLNNQVDITNKKYEELESLLEQLKQVKVTIDTTHDTITKDVKAIIQEANDKIASVMTDLQSLETLSKQTTEAYNNLKLSVEQEFSIFKKNVETEQSTLRQTTDQELSVFRKGVEAERGTLRQTIDQELSAFKKGVEAEQATFRQTTDQELGAFRKGIEAERVTLAQTTENELKAFKKNIETEQATFKQTTAQELNAFRKAVEAEQLVQKQYFEKASSDFQTAFVQTQEEREKEFSVYQEACSKEFNSTIENYDNKMNEEFLGLTAKATTIIEILEKFRDDAKQVLGVVVNTAQAGVYKTYADEEQRIADWFRRSTSFFMLLGIIILIGPEVKSIFLDGIHNTVFDWHNWLDRVPVAIILFAPTFYFSRESTKHRGNEFKNRKIQHILSTVDPYLELLNNGKQKEDFKVELARQLFSPNENDCSSKPDNDGENLLKQIIRFVSKVNRLLPKSEEA